MHIKKNRKEFYSFAICIVSWGEHSTPLSVTQGKDLNWSHGRRREKMKEQSKAIRLRTG